MKILGFILAMLGYLTLYLTHPNQTLIEVALQRQYRWLAGILLFLSFIILVVKLPALVAIYMLMITAIVMWSFIPFIPLFQKLKQHEITKISKNSR